MLHRDETIVTASVYNSQTVLSILTEKHAAVVEQVAEMLEHGTLVLAAGPAEVAQEPTAHDHHLCCCILTHIQTSSSATIQPSHHRSLAKTIPVLSDGCVNDTP